MLLYLQINVYENSYLRNHRRENLKSQLIFMLFLKVDGQTNAWTKD
jgi:hypothetical protein